MHKEARSDVFTLTAVFGCCKANVAFFVVAEESLCDRVFVNTHLPVGQTLRLFIANGDKVPIRKCWKLVATFPPFSGNCNKL